MSILWANVTCLSVAFDSVTFEEKIDGLLVFPPPLSDPGPRRSRDKSRTLLYFPNDVAGNNLFDVFFFFNARQNVRAFNIIPHSCAACHEFLRYGLRTSKKYNERTRFADWQRTHNFKKNVEKLEQKNTSVLCINKRQKDNLYLARKLNHSATAGNARMRFKRLSSKSKNKYEKSS